jgi:hypothetical protein
MNFNKQQFTEYSKITYKINFATDLNAKPKTNVENLNDYREARMVINSIKNKLRKK